MSEITQNQIQKAGKNSLTLFKKVEMIKAVERGDHSRSFIAKEFGVAKSTVTDVLKKRDRIIEAYEVSKYGPERKRLRTSSYADVEESLMCWLKQARSLDIPISGPTLQEKGRELAILMGHPDFTCSKGWLHRFKSRHGIMFRQACGSHSSSSIQNGSSDDWLSGKLPRLLVEYSPHNVFCADETSFFWKALPDSMATLSGVTCSDGSRSTERFTVLVCTNMTGEEKLPLLVIGKCSEPRLFANVRTLPVLYEANDRALMVGKIFSSWLVLIDKKFQQEGRKVAMIVDNSACHSNMQSRLEAVKLVFLPPHLTSELQPCDQGIVKSLKINYRKYLLIKLITVLEAKEDFLLDLLDALHLLHLSWVNVSQTTIGHSFSCSGFKHHDTPTTHDIDSTLTYTEIAGGESLLKQLCRTGLPDSHSLSFEQYVDIDRDVITAPVLSDDGTALEVSSLQAEADVEGDPGDDSACLLSTPPSARDAEKASKVLRQYFEARSGMEQALNLVAELEKRVLDCYIQPQLM